YSGFSPGQGLLTLKSMARSAWPGMAIGLVLAVLAACVLIGINEAGHNRSVAALGNMTREFDTRGSLNRLLQHVLDAETGSRGFLLTGDPRYLEPYDKSVSEIARDLQALRVSYADSPTQSAVVG